MLVQDCTCGEPVLDDMRKCPRCDRANPRYRHPRWRTFWPEIDTLILLGLINGVRGTFLRPRMLRMPRPEVFD